MLKIHKVVAVLPEVLEPNSIYFVRAGIGYDQYVTDQTGAIAHTMNVAAGGQQQVFAQSTQPIVPAGVPYIWFKTGLGDGSEMMMYIEDGT